MDIVRRTHESRCGKPPRGKRVMTSTVIEYEFDDTEVRKALGIREENAPITGVSWVSGKVRITMGYPR